MSFTHSCVTSVQTYYRPNKVTIVRSTIRGALPRVVQDVTVGSRALPGVPWKAEGGWASNPYGAAARGRPIVGCGVKPHDFSLRGGDWGNAPFQRSYFRGAGLTATSSFRN